MKLALSSQLSALSKGSCGDGRPARPSGAKLRPVCPRTNVAKFLHLQALSSRIYWKIIPCSGPSTGERVWVTTLSPARKWNSVIAPAAKRRNREARHVSAGKRVGNRRVPEGRHTGYDFFHALRSVNSVISGGTPSRTGKPRVPRPQFT